MLRRIEGTIKPLLKATLPSAWLDALRNSTFYHRRIHCEHVRSFEASAEPELTIVRRLVKPGDTVVDVGSNLGIYTKFLSEWIGKEGRVISIEPVPQTFAFLVHNVKHLRLSNVVALRVAMADHDGRGQMEIPLDQGGKRNIYLPRLRDTALSCDDRTIEVDVRKLDSVLPAGSRPTFVKVDVEGRELSVIKGGAVTIRDARPQLLIEITGDPEDSSTEASELWEFLCDLSYVACVLDGQRLRLWRRGDRRVNYFFLTPTVARGIAVE